MKNKIESNCQDLLAVDSEPRIKVGKRGNERYRSCVNGESII